MIPTLRGENGQKGDFTLFYDEVDDVILAPSKGALEGRQTGVVEPLQSDDAPLFEVRNRVL